MYSKKLYYILSGLIFFFAAVKSVSGQVKEWGDISVKELNIDVYAVDSSASAVVLFDYGNVNFNRNLEYELERHVRIKLLREEGYDYATIELPFNEEFDQKISKLRGATYFLNGQGKIEKNELDRQSIYEEEIVNEWKRVKFTLPRVRPGSIIEYKYKKLIGPPNLLPDWEFQKKIPVLWSEYQVKIPEWFKYNKLFMGTNELHIQDSKSFSDRINFTLKRRTGTRVHQTRFHNAYVNVDGDVERWVMKNLPAVKSLPYMTTVDDYKSKLWMQLTGIHLPNQIPQNFLKTWEDVNRELFDSEKFGKQLSSNSRFSQQVKRITQGLTKDKNKVEAAYQYITDSFTWNGNYSILAYSDLEDVFEKKQGTSAELNLLLVQLLRDAGLNAHPVLLSTRDHGRVFTFYAITNQFNHVICYVEADGEEYLLDATVQDMPITMLPSNDLNGSGLMIKERLPEWVEINVREKTKDTKVLNASLNTDGTLQGDFFSTSTGFFAINGLKRLKKSKQNYDDKEVLNRLGSFVVDSFQVDDIKASNSQLAFSIQFSSLKPSNVQATEDFIYFNPTLFMRQQENPFKQPERTIPVNFPYSYEKKFIANYTLPDGYVVEELPKSQKYKLFDDSATYSRIIQEHNGTLTIQRIFTLTRTSYDPKEYQILREFYRLLVTKDNEMVILKRL